MMVTALDVARLAGVSQATVSYVMNGRKRISPETQARVRQAMKQLGYFPNANARALAAHRTGVIGVVIRIDENTQMAEMLPYISAIVSECNSLGYSITLIPADDDMQSILLRTGQSQVDGLIVFDIEWHDPRIAELARLSRPVILIGTAENSEDLSSVDVNYSRIAQLAINELLDAGAQRVLCIADYGRDSTTYAFARTFTQETQNIANVLGISYGLFVPEKPGWQGIWDVRDFLLANRANRCGIAVRTPQTLEWLLQLMSECNIRPHADDMPVVAVCADEYAKKLRTPVSNIDPMAKEISLAAIHRLISTIEGKDLHPTRTLVQPRSTKRSTT